MKLQAKYTLAITAIIVAVSLLVTFTLHSRFSRTADDMVGASLAVLDTTLLKNVQEDGRETAELLGGQLARPLAEGNAAPVAAALRTLLSEDKGVRWAATVDREGRPVAAAGMPAASPFQVPPRARFEREGNLLLITQPLLWHGVSAGALRLALSLDSIDGRHREMESALRATEAASRQKEKQQLAVLLALLLAAGLLLGVLTARTLARPVRALARDARAIAASEAGVPQPTARGEDEIAELTRAFGQMRDSLSRTTVSRDFLHRIIDNLQEGLVVTDSRGDIRLCNRAAAALFGRPEADLIGEQFTNLLPDPRLFTAAGCTMVESALPHPARGGVPVEIYRSRLGDDAEAEQVWLVSDIAERKAMEEELGAYRDRLEQLVVERTKELTTAVQELESFSYSVSHDLHAPLRAINGFGAALIEEYYSQLDATGRDYLDRMNSATVRMGQLIDGLLVLTRVVRREIHREPVDLSAIASESAAELAATDPRRQVTFRIAPGVTAFADRALMQLLVQNLIGNAWKFTRDRHSALIELGQTEREGSRTFFVRDNGAGFDSGSAQGIFRPFSRLPVHKEFPGTGIGLATVQRIVARHGGEVWAEAGSGVGATFHFTLPDQVARQVEERRVSSRKPLSKSVNSQRPSRTA